MSDENWTDGHDEYDDRLGPVVLRCRPRTVPGWFAAQGFQPLVAHFLRYFAVFFGALVLTLPLRLIQEGAEPDWPVWIGWYTLCCLLLGWLFFVQPRWDHLVLHEKGFRFRVLYQAARVEFAGLAAIRLGGPLTVTEHIGLIYTEFAHRSDLQEVMLRARLTRLVLVYPEGAPRMLRSFLTRFESEDTLRFFELLVKKHPGLLAEGPPND